MGVVGPAANNTGTTADIYGECMKWQRFSYSDDVNIFTPAAYPALWQTYGSDCFDKGKFSDTKCDAAAVKTKAASAKNFCTNEKSTATTTASGDGSASSGDNSVTADNPSDACIELGFSDGNCATDCDTSSGYTQKGTTPCKNSKKLCCK
jgi:hypothetical protein